MRGGTSRVSWVGALADDGIFCTSTGAFVLLRLMKNEMFVVEHDRWAVFTAIVLALLAEATIAGYLPARKSSRLDSTSVLREE